MQNQAEQKSPFEIVTPNKNKKGGSKGMIVAILIVVFLILSVVAGVLLVKQRQNIQEKAAASLCPAAEACPFTTQKTLLRNCHPPEADGSPSESLCNVAGRVEFCGTQNFCCPGPNQPWTTNMTACATPTPSPTATPTPTPSPTATATPAATATANPTATPAHTATPGATPTATAAATKSPTPTAAATKSPTPVATATAQVSATAQPIPVTGTDWPTILGAGVGIFVIVASILIAL